MFDPRRLTIRTHVRACLLDAELQARMESWTADVQLAVATGESALNRSVQLWRKRLEEQKAEADANISTMAVRAQKLEEKLSAFAVALDDSQQKERVDALTVTGWVHKRCCYWQCH